MPLIDLEYDPDGKKELVSVDKRGAVYKESGLKNSNHPEVESLLYDQLCSFNKAKLRDEVRKIAHSNALSVKDKDFKPTVQWLDNFMRRFSLSKKKPGSNSSHNIKVKIKGSKALNAVGSGKDDTLLNKNEDAMDDSASLNSDKKVLQNGGDETNGTANSSSDIESLEFIPSNENNAATPSTINSIIAPSDTEDSVETQIFPLQTKNKIESDNEPAKISEGIRLVSLANLLDPTKFISDTKEKVFSTNDDSLILLDSDSSPSKKSSRIVPKIEDKSSEKNKKNNNGTSDEDIIAISDDDVETEDSKNSASTSEESEHEDSDVRKWEDINAVDYSEKEDKYYSNNISVLQRRLEEKITQCTACYAQVNHVTKQEVFTHPVLGVLLCKKCCKFYGKGTFQKDEEGYDEYCRWCANGGDLFLCDKCSNGFCRACVKRNIGRSAIKNIETSKSWICYVCNRKPLHEARALHRVILDGLRSKELLKEGLSRSQINKSNVKDRFVALKVKRHTKKLDLKATPEVVKKKHLQSKADDDLDQKINDKNLIVEKVTEKSKKMDSQQVPSDTPADWIDSCISDILELLSACRNKVESISYNSSTATEKEKSKVHQKLQKISNVMKNNFTDIEQYINKKPGLPNTLSTPDKEQHKSPHKSPSKSKKAKLRSPRKKVHSSSSDEDLPKSPPKRRSPIKKRKRTSESSEEEIRPPNQRKKGGSSDDKELEFIQNRDGVDVKKNKNGEETSNGGSDDANSSLDKASSNNPNGSDQGGDMLPEDTEPNPLSPITMHDDSADDHENSADKINSTDDNYSVSKEDQEKEKTVVSKQNGADDLSQQSSLSESVLKDLADETNIIKKVTCHAENSEDENTTTFAAEKQQICELNHTSGNNNDSNFGSDGNSSFLSNEHDEVYETCSEFSSEKKDKSEKTISLINKDSSNTGISNGEILGTAPINDLTGLNQEMVKLPKNDSSDEEKVIQPINSKTQTESPEKENGSLTINNSDETNEKQIKSDSSDNEPCKESSVAKIKAKSKDGTSLESQISNEEAHDKLLASDSSSEEQLLSEKKSKVCKGSSKASQRSLRSKTSKDNAEDNHTTNPLNESHDLFTESDCTKLESDKNVTTKKSKNENVSAKKSLLASDSSDDEIFPNLKSKKAVARKSTSKKSIKVKKKIKGYSASPQSVKNIKQKSQLDSAIVKVFKLDYSLKSELEANGFISLKDYPSLTEVRTPNGSAIDSDEEFEALLNFKATKSLCAKTSDDASDEDEDDDEEDELENKIVDKSDAVKEKETLKRNKKEGLMDISLNDEEDDTEETKVEDDKELSKDGTSSINDKMKSALLMSSDEEKEDSASDVDVDDILDKKVAEELEDERRKKFDMKKSKIKLEDQKKRESEESESEDEELKTKTKKKYFSLKFSSDEEDANEKGEDENEDDDDDDEDESPRKTRMFAESDSDFELETKPSKKNKNSVFASSNDESSESEDDEKDSKKSKSRKRIKRTTSSSDEDVTEVDGVDQDSPSKKRRRKIIHDEDLLQSTKEATLEERERVDRLKERQKLYNKLFEIDAKDEHKNMESLVLDFDEKSKEELVTVNKKLLTLLKPHQAEGIKFMYDATIESLERLENGEKGSGCILAHCMGLGKTLQVIAIVHALLTNKKMNNHIQRVMVCCPVNTVYNWVAEFNNWLKGKLMSFDVVELVSVKSLWQRAYRLDDWYKEGGVCIVGYDMFRNLSNENNKKYKGQMKAIFQKALVKPGPDFMVCDEGHILKNEKTALSIAINKIQTARRVVLTGTPLQNNLKEYHCMIQFVKPNLLGTKKEFMNRFVNPITAGQTYDAEPRDVRRMKRRAHILHNLLEGCVQRFDYTVLKPFLPPKFEYVISVQMSECQMKLYDYYLKNLAQGGPKRTGSGLFVDFNNLSRIWSHPAVLYLALKRRENQGLEDEEEEDGDLEGFIDDEDVTTDSSEDERTRRKKNRKKKKEESEEDIVQEVKNEDDEEPREITDENTPGLTSTGKVKADWWRSVLESIVGENYDEDEFLNRMDISGKLYLLLDILQECASIGDKVLVFSQSILALDMIENFLRMVDEGELKLPECNEDLHMQFEQWKPGRDYIRLDGSTCADDRKNQCKQFNRPDNERCRLFLISTRAGGVGINLIGANRVIIFDSSWNPSHDTQSIFRVYRFGQKKPCYIYRFVAQGTMEDKIYSRQVTKIATSLRVVDEHQIKRHFKLAELAELYQFEPEDPTKRETPIVPEDRLLAEMLRRNSKWIVGYHEHDSLLENQAEEQLTEEERKAAWEDFENEKKGLVQQQPRMMNNGAVPNFEVNSIIQSIRNQNPNISHIQLQSSILLATKQIQAVHVNQYRSVQQYLYQLKNPLQAAAFLQQFPANTNLHDLIASLENQIEILRQNIGKEAQVIDNLSKDPKLTLSANNMMSAGLMTGVPSTSAVSVSNTAQYVNRNIDTTNKVTLSHVKPNFKTVTVPPVSIIPKPKTKISAADTVKSTSLSTGTDDPLDENQKSAEVVTLE